MGNKTRERLFIVLLVLLCIDAILFAYLQMRSRKPFIDCCPSPRLEDFQRSCERYCEFLSFDFYPEEMERAFTHLRFSEWCIKSFQPYDPKKCATRDRCYSQKIGDKCNIYEDTFSKDYPEKVKINCSFEPVRGITCNPDEIEDGWIKCCKEPSLVNCNCRPST